MGAFYYFPLSTFVHLIVLGKKVFNDAENATYEELVRAT